MNRSNALPRTAERRTLSLSLRNGLLILASLVFSPQHVFATPLIYAYTGNVFNDAASQTGRYAGTNLTGTLEFDDSALLTGSAGGSDVVETEIVALSLSAGPDTAILGGTGVTIQFGPSFVRLSGSTIVDWLLSLRFELTNIGNTSLLDIIIMQTSNNVSGTDVDSVQLFADNNGGTQAWYNTGRTNNSPGSWSRVTQFVPEPATIVLLSLGLAGIGFRRRKA